MCDKTHLVIYNLFHFLYFLANFENTYMSFCHRFSLPVAKRLLAQVPFLFLYLKLSVSSPLRNLRRPFTWQRCLFDSVEWLARLHTLSDLSIVLGNHRRGPTLFWLC